MSYFSYLSVLLGALGLLGSTVAAPAQDKPYKIEQLQIEDVGEFSGPQVLRIVMLTMQPGADIPEHEHSGPGLRYVVDGAITVADKSGEQVTYTAGETYFEGPGANHPAGEISAHGSDDGTTHVLIIEVLPK